MEPVSVACRDGALVDRGRFDVEGGRHPEESHKRVAESLARAIGQMNPGGAARPR